MKKLFAILFVLLYVSVYGETDIQKMNKYLCLSIKVNDIQKVKSAFKLGAQADAIYDNTPALIWAVIIGNIEIVEEILKNNPNLELKDEKQKTALCAAVIDNQEKIALLLISNGANVNSKAQFDITPLMIAVGIESLSLVKILLNNKADIHAKDDRGDTALDYAKHINNKEIINILIENGAK